MPLKTHRGTTANTRSINQGRLLETYSSFYKCYAYTKAIHTDGTSYWIKNQDLTDIIDLKNIQYNETNDVELDEYFMQRSGTYDINCETRLEYLDLTNPPNNILVFFDKKDNVIAVNSRAANEQKANYFQYEGRLIPPLFFDTYFIEAPTLMVDRQFNSFRHLLALQDRVFGGVTLVLDDNIYYNLKNPYILVKISETILQSTTQKNEIENGYELVTNQSDTLEIAFVHMKNIDVEDIKQKLYLLGDYSRNIACQSKITPITRVVGSDPILQKAKDVVSISLTVNYNHSQQYVSAPGELIKEIPLVINKDF